MSRWKPGSFLFVCNHANASVQSSGLLIVGAIQMAIVMGSPLGQFQLLLVVRQNAFQLVLGALARSLLSTLLLRSQHKKLLHARSKVEVRATAKPQSASELALRQSYVWAWARV